MFPIYMWMECCRYLQISVNILPKCSLKGTNKFGIHVYKDDAPWYPKFHPNIFKEHVCCFMSFDGIFTRHKNAHLVEHVKYQKKIVMFLLGCYQTTYKIHVNNFVRLIEYR